MQTDRYIDMLIAIVGTPNGGKVIYYRFIVCLGVLLNCVIPDNININTTTGILGAVVLFI